MKNLVGFLVLAAAAGVGNAAEQDTAYWTSSYAGPAAGALRCVAPAVPAVSEVSQRMRHVARSIKQWQNCHRGVIASLDPSQAAAHIPADALARMSPVEQETATRHVAAVHAQLAQAMQLEAVPIIAQHDAWLENTVAYVVKSEALTPGLRAEAWNGAYKRSTQTSERVMFRYQAQGLPAHIPLR